MSLWILSKKDELEYENMRLLESFNKRNVSCHLVNPDDFDYLVEKNGKKVFYKGVKTSLPQIVLVRFGAGIEKHTVALLKHFENNGVICINSSKAIDLARDKLFSLQLLAKNSIDIPKSIPIQFPLNNFEVISKEIGYPCIIKVLIGSYGEGVYKCDDENSFKKLCEFLHSLKVNKLLLAQEFVSEKIGEDLRVIVIDGEVIGVMKRTAPKDDFRANITNGGTGEMYQLTKEIKTIAEKSAKVLGLDIAGIDLLFDKDGFKVCEANSNPGFNGFEKYCSIDISEKIVEYIVRKIKEIQ